MEVNEIEMTGIRRIVESVDAWIDKHGGPCMLAWASLRLPRFSNWFWKDA